MEKDDRRSQRFLKSKKYLTRHPYAQKKKSEARNERPERTPETSGRTRNREIAEETQSLVEQGFYMYENNSIDIKKTPCIFYPQKIFFEMQKRNYETQYKIYDTTTISACKDMYFSLCTPPCVLVFASAKNPGGGWLKGANAQEESICRCSALYESCKYSNMYITNSEAKNSRGVYTDNITYCPSVPIFRDEEGEFEPEIYYGNFLLCPAVNASICKKEQKVETLMTERIERILYIMAVENQENILLGSYGCGVFGNKPETIFKIFYNLLHGKYKNSFQTVSFSLPDPEHRRIFTSIFQ